MHVRPSAALKRYEQLLQPQSSNGKRQKAKFANAVGDSFCELYPVMTAYIKSMHSQFSLITDQTYASEGFSQNESAFPAADAVFHSILNF